MTLSIAGFIQAVQGSIILDLSQMAKRQFHSSLNLTLNCTAPGVCGHPAPCAELSLCLMSSLRRPR